MDRQGDHLHLHAIVETTLDAGLVAGQWIAAGGGIDHDARWVNPTEDDLARVTGYVVKGCRWTGLGRSLCSQSLGYNSEKARAQRRAYVEETYGATRAHEQFERVSVESLGATLPEGAEKAAPQLSLFVSAEPTPTCSVSPVRGGTYALVTSYDPFTQRASVVASRVVRRGARPEYVALKAVASKVDGRRFLRHVRRGDALVRQRFAKVDR